MKLFFRMGGVPFAVLVLISVVMETISYSALMSLPHPSLFPCTASWAENLILSLLLVILIQIFLAPRVLRDRCRIFLALHAVALLFVAYSGIYLISPLGYSTGRIPNLSGFQIVRMNRTSTIKNRGIISVSQDSFAAISPILLDKKSDCVWMSTKGGQLDLPSTCDIIYIPPNAEFDVLHLRVRSACGLPSSTAQIKVSVLP